MTEDSTRATLRRRVLQLLDRRLSSTNPKVERRLLLIATAAFLGGAAWAWIDVRETITLDWRFLLANAALGVPLTIALNATEYRLGAGLVGARPTFGDAMTVSILGSAANLLPLPGAALVRIRALRQEGSGYGKATRVTAAIGVAFVAIAGAVAAIAAAVIDATAIAWAFGAIAAVGAVIVTVILGGAHRPSAGWTLRLIAIEVAALALIAGRFALSFRAIGVTPTLATVSLMAAAGPLASASGILPGGIGLREGLAAFLADQAGTAAASGFLAVALDRVIALAVAGVLSLVLTYRNPSLRRPTPE